MKKYILYIAAILMLCSSVARADDLKDTEDAYKKGNYAQVIELLLPLVAQGDAEAQFRLGWIYAEGKGVTQDYKEAVKWYRLAAKQGEVVAQYNLGVMYDEGKGVKQDYVRAYMWFNLAASKGYKNGSKNREKVTKKMTPAQIADAQKMARDCEKKKYKNCE